ncbi:MAG: glutamine-hydrolyzing carbamoyl-phosphate synthase small subunit [Nevskiales bacterium]
MTQQAAHSAGSTPALLALADGSLFHGVAIGADGTTVGEVVFNTAITGYQEILTDPSYKQQIVTLTYPHIGNVGANREDVESNEVYAAGLIIREVPRARSNWRGEENLSDYLQRNKVVAIADIDTRRLTRILREQGAQNGCIMAGKIDEAEALRQARAFPGLKGADLAKVVTVNKAYEWTEPSWASPGTGKMGSGKMGSESSFPPSTGSLGKLQSKKIDSDPIFQKKHVVVYDFGVKRNILRSLVDAGCRLTVVPAQTSAADVLKLKPDGVLLSNGPGDPEPCSYAIEAAQQLMQQKLPVMGICLGHQILGLACGAKTVKMKFGHHGANHPVQDLKTGQVMISSQNHGFAVDEATLPKNVMPTYRSLFDGSLQGIERSDIPAFSFQGHPEASPGPHDVSPLFRHFIQLMDKKNA